MAERLELDAMDYNDRYDATVAKGLCLECGGQVRAYWSWGEPAQLVSGEVIYPHRPDLHWLRFWKSGMKSLSS